MRGMGSGAIEVSGLVKTFGGVRALDGLDLQVATGEVHGFLGPNGAGKSTTLRVLLGLLRADAGDARLLGGDPWRDAVALHRRLAYVPGDVNLWPTSPAARRSTCSAGCAAASTRARRARAARALRARPDQEGPRLLEGQPPEGRARRRARLRRRAARCSTSRPPGSTRSWRRSSRRCIEETRDARADRAALEPHPRRGRGAVRPGDASSARARPSRAGRSSELRHLTRTSISVETAQGRATSAGSRASTTSTSRTTAPASTSTATTSTRRSGGSPPTGCAA